MMHTSSSASGSLKRVSTVAIALLALAGCANKQELHQQLVYSSAAVEQARMSGNPADYAIARDKLARANAAARSQDNVVAMRLAEEAQVDAELAQAKANSARAMAAAAEVDKSNQALRQTIARPPQPAGAKP